MQRLLRALSPRRAFHAKTPEPAALTTARTGGLRARSPPSARATGRGKRASLGSCLEVRTVASHTRGASQTCRRPRRAGTRLRPRGRSCFCQLVGAERGLGGAPLEATGVSNVGGRNGG